MSGDEAGGPLAGLFLPPHALQRVDGDKIPLLGEHAGGVARLVLFGERERLLGILFQSAPGAVEELGLCFYRRFDG